MPVAQRLHSERTTLGLEKQNFWHHSHVAAKTLGKLMKTAKNRDATHGRLTSGAVDIIGPRRWQQAGFGLPAA